jgi:hypothetical protein
VEERPERVVADPAVEVLLLVGREEHGEEEIACEVAAHLLLERCRDDGTRPPDPPRVAAHRPESL